MLCTINYAIGAYKNCNQSFEMLNSTWKLHWNFAAFILIIHALNSFWFSTCFNDSAFCFKLNCSTKIFFIFMPTLCTTRITKNLGQVSFFIIWDKMALDKLSSGASWNRKSWAGTSWLGAKWHVTVILIYLTIAPLPFLKGTIEGGQLKGGQLLSRSVNFSSKNVTQHLFGNNKFKSCSDISFRKKEKL